MKDTKKRTSYSVDNDEEWFAELERVDDIVRSRKRAYDNVLLAAMVIVVVVGVVGLLVIVT